MRYAELALAAYRAQPRLASIVPAEARKCAGHSFALHSSSGRPEHASLQAGATPLIKKISTVAARRRVEFRLVHCSCWSMPIRIAVASDTVQIFSCQVTTMINAKLLCMLRFTND